MGTETDIARAMRECFDPESIEEWRQPLVLPDQPENYSNLPDRVLLILFASRAGSTYAGHLLANTPYFRRVTETLNPEPLRREREAANFSNDAETLRNLIERRGTRHAFGVKCGEPGLIAAWHLGFLDVAMERATVTLLKRRDVVAQAVSLYRAELSGRYHSPQEAIKKVTIGDYDREQIAMLLDIIEEVYDMLTRFLERIGKPYETVFYEDVSADPEGFVRSTCERIGLDVPDKIDTNVSLKVLRDGISEDWSRRFRAER